MTLTGNITKQAPYSGNAVANTAEGNLERRRNIFTIAGVSIADNSMNVKHTTSGIGSHECSLENCGRLPVYSG